MNQVVSALLQSPLHWVLSRDVMLLTYAGRRSGQQITVPIQYAELEGAVVVLVGEPVHKQWWRNFQTPAPVTIRIRGRDLHGVARRLGGDSPEARTALGRYFQKFPVAARMRGLMAANATVADVAPLDRQEILVLVELTHS